MVKGQDHPSQIGNKNASALPEFSWNITDHEYHILQRNSNQGTFVLDYLRKNHKSDSLQGHSGLLWCDLHDSATWPDDKGSQWTWKWWMLDTKAGRECCLWVLAKRQLCRKKHVTRPDITRHLSADFFWYVSGVDTQLADLHSDTCAIHEIYWFQALLPVPGGRHPEEGQWFCDVGCCHSLHACFF